VGIVATERLTRSAREFPPSLLNGIPAIRLAYQANYPEGVAVNGTPNPVPELVCPPGSHGVHYTVTLRQGNFSLKTIMRMSDLWILTSLLIGRCPSSGLILITVV
jgi:hypothetical protein